MSPRGSLEKAVEHRDEVDSTPSIPVCIDEEEEPELHIKTWLALVTMGIVQYTSLMALVGPPTVVSYNKNYINTNTNSNLKLWCNG